jgi:hypothetical protein
MSTQAGDYTHREIQEFLGVFALDAVDRETATMVELHLQECVKCSIEVAQYHAVAGLLANSGGTSPVRLWDGIASQLHELGPPSWEHLANRLEPADTQAGLYTWSADEQDHGEADPRDPEVVGITAIPITSGHRAGLMLRRAAGTAAVAAVVAAIALGVQVNHLDHQVNASQTPTLLTQAEQASLGAPSTKQVQLTSLRGTSGSTAVGRVTVVLTKSGTGFVEAEGLSPLPGTKTYQLWGVIGSQTISLGLLGSDPTVVPFSVAGDTPVEAFAITAEHSGGVVQSSNQPVVAGVVTT